MRAIPVNVRSKLDDVVGVNAPAVVPIGSSAAEEETYPQEAGHDHGPIFGGPAYLMSLSL